jgi:periplasmic protein TonB
MGYVDTNHARPSAATITGTLLINGLMVAGILSAVPEVAHEGYKIFRMIPLIQPPPPPIPVTRQPVKSDQPKTATNPLTSDPVTTPITPVITPVITDFRLPPGDLVIGDPGSGEITAIKPPAPPVFVNATINMRNRGDLQPLYPPGLIRLGIAGSVTVRVLVGTDGRVKQVEPVRVADPGFLTTTRDQALRKWRFTPATRDGVPVESWREMTVRFELPD